MGACRVMAVIRLAWPHRDSHPNSRVHWSKRAKANKAMRSAAYYLAKASGIYVPGEGEIPLLITFYPPDRRRRDLDGCLSAMKSQLDGIADALKVNDSRFVPTIRMSDKTGGYVEVEVRS